MIKIDSFSECIIKEFRSSVEAYFSKRHWKRKICPICESIFYTKRDIENCESYFCLGKYSFLNFPGKKRFIKPVELFEEASKFFEKRGLRRVTPKNVVSSSSEILFIGAGIQAFSNELLKGSCPSEFFLAQPCIRMKALKRVGVIEGYSTSFVNICTEKRDVNIMDYLYSIDEWLDFLSSVGLYVGYLTLREKLNWKGRAMEGISLLLQYGGLEIGDAVYIYHFTQQNNTQIQQEITISDVGLGLERVCWALNKTASYFDAIGPISEVFYGNIVSIDALRTMTLMAASGVLPSNNNHGYQFRKISKNYHLSHNLIPSSHIAYYYNFWNKFTSLPISLEDVQNIISKELYRNFNLNLFKNLGIQFDSISYETEIEETLNKLIKCGVDIDELRKIYKELKK
jgi:hypothetical protein